MKAQPLIAIVGPTAIGKSTVAIALAEKYNGAIISADSRQIYTEFSIGSGKITPLEQKNIPHYGIDIRHIWDHYSVYEYQKEALGYLHDIQETHKLPFIVGGTGLYVSSITEQYEFKPTVPYNSDLHQYTLAQLQSEYQKHFPDILLNNSDWNNPIRLIRALQRTQPSHSHHRPNTLMIGLTTDKETINSRINLRVKERFDNGVIEECRNMLFLTQAVMPKELAYKHLTRLGLGTKYILEYLIDGRYSLETLIQRYCTTEHQYAKRQLTWFRKNPYIIWHDIAEKDFMKVIEQKVSQFFEDESNMNDSIDHI